MKYVILTLAWFVGIASVGEFMSADSAAADGIDGETTADSLNIRTGPSVHHKVVSVLRRGTPVSVLEVEDGWARVAADPEGRVIHGWISGRYLDVYEVALPQVASSGLSEPLETELPILSEVDDQPVADNDPDADLAEGIDTASAAEGAATVDSADAAEPEEVASLDNTVNEGLDSGADAGVAIANDEPTANDAVPADTDIQVAIGNDDTDETNEEMTEVASVEPTAATTLEKENDEPLAYQALDISCRQSYFSDALEACTADIKVDVAVPDNFAELVSESLNVKCDVGFSYEAGGDKLLETKSDAVQVILEDGKGSAILQSRIDFLFRVDNVTRVEVTELDCAGASALN